MNGLSNYSDVDNTSGVDHLNLSAGRVGVVGALIHTTSGSDSLGWLSTGAARAGNPASADYLIDRDGARHRLCPDGFYPYHAGKSRLIYNGRLYSGDEISEMLLGVELENRDSEYCTFSQLDSLADLIVTRGLSFGWRWPYYVLGHYEVATPVGRRSDPLGFLWGDFLGRLYVRAQHAAVDGLI